MPDTAATATPAGAAPRYSQRLQHEERKDSDDVKAAVAAKGRADEATAAAAEDAPSPTSSVDSPHTTTLPMFSQPTQRGSSTLGRHHHHRHETVLHHKLVDAVKLGVTNFLLVYNVRAGIAVMLRLFKLLRSRALSMEYLLAESRLSFRVDAVQLGLFIGGFTGLYKAALAVMQHLRGQNDGLNAFVAGGVAGVSLLALDPGRRRTLALYLMVRAFQCMYNSAKARGWWHMWGSDWAYGDSLLFALTSAQVMYAYALRPESLPPSYYKFIVTTGPIREYALQITRNAIRGKPLDVAKVLEFVKKHGGRIQPPPIVDPHPALIPCCVLHPQQASCTKQVARTFTDGFQRSFPLYLSLHVVPAVVLRFGSFVQRPLKMLMNAMSGTLRSCTFLSTFVAGYMAVICIQRRIMPWDHKLVYWVAGFLASGSILIEGKSRRSELALYVLPRAIDSLFMILRDRRVLVSLPQGEMLLFAASMAAIMYFYEHENSTVSSLLAKALKRFLHNSATQ